jgi:hypothetical protein
VRREIENLLGVVVSTDFLGIELAEFEASTIFCQLQSLKEKEVRPVNALRERILR